MIHVLISNLQNSDPVLQATCKEQREGCPPEFWKDSEEDQIQEWRAAWEAPTPALSGHGYPLLLPGTCLLCGFKPGSRPSFFFFPPYRETDSSVFVFCF